MNESRLKLVILGLIIVIMSHIGYTYKLTQRVNAQEGHLIETASAVVGLVNFLNSLLQPGDKGTPSEGSQK